MSQAGIGSAYKVVSEFSLDILHKFGIKKRVESDRVLSSRITKANSKGSHPAARCVETE